MEKNLKLLIRDIEKEFESYAIIYGEDNILHCISYFENILKDFYDSYASYILNYYLHNNLSYNDTIRRYVDMIPYTCIYNEYLSKKNSGLDLLDFLVFETRKSLTSSPNPKLGTKLYTYFQCGFASSRFQTNALKFNNIKSLILNTSRSFGLFDEGENSRSHSFNLVFIDDKPYVVDCTFSQFTKLFYMTPHAMKILSCISAEPAYFLSQTKEGQNLLNKLLEYGYFEATPDNLKLYLDSFVLSERNAFYYLDGGKMVSDIEASYYSEIISEFKNYNWEDFPYGVIKYGYGNEKSLDIYGTDRQIGAKYNCILHKDELNYIDNIINKKIQLAKT